MYNIYINNIYCIVCDTYIHTSPKSFDSSPPSTSTICMCISIYTVKHMLVLEYSRDDIVCIYYMILPNTNIMSVYSCGVHTGIHHITHNNYESYIIHILYIIHRIHYTQHTYLFGQLKRCGLQTQIPTRRYRQHKPEIYM